MKIKEWDGYFLRDDKSLRNDLPEEEREAYSLFRLNPYGRVKVFCGSLSWAIKEAEKEILLDKKNA